MLLAGTDQISIFLEPDLTGHPASPLFHLHPHPHPLSRATDTLFLAPRPFLVLTPLSSSWFKHILSFPVLSISHAGGSVEMARCFLEEGSPSVLGGPNISLDLSSPEEGPLHAPGPA